MRATTNANGHTTGYEYIFEGGGGGGKRPHATANTICAVESVGAPQRRSPTSPHDELSPHHHHYSLAHDEHDDNSDSHIEFIDDLPPDAIDQRAVLRRIF